MIILNNHQRINKMNDTFNVIDKKDLYLQKERLEPSILNIEKYLEYLLNNYIYGYKSAPETNIKDIYCFIIKTACEMVNRGAVFSKWIIGKEILNNKTFNGFITDMPLAIMLIEMAAHENQKDACEYMAKKYTNFEYNNNVSKYWLNKYYCYNYGSIKNTIKDLYFFDINNKEIDEHGIGVGIKRRTEEWHLEEIFDIVPRFQNKQEIFMKEKIDITSKKEMFAYKEKIILSTKDMEIYISILLNNYVYGDLNIIDTTKQEIYWFIVETACEMVNRGAVFSKWLIGRELIDDNSLMRNADKILGKFLIEMAAHENQKNACEHMARRYYDFNFGDCDIGEYWRNRESDYGYGRAGEILDLRIHNTENKITKEYWKTVKLHVPSHEWWLDDSYNLIKKK